MIAYCFSLTRADQRSLLCQVPEIARGGRRGRSGDRHIFTGAEAAGKSARTFAEHPKQGFLLPGVKSFSFTYAVSKIILCLHFHASGVHYGRS